MTVFSSGETRGCCWLSEKEPNPVVKKGEDDFLETSRAQIYLCSLSGGVCNLNSILVGILDKFSLGLVVIHDVGVDDPSLYSIII